MIPVWFTSAPPGVFDESSRVGGLTFDPKGNTEEQLRRTADLLKVKIGMRSRR